MKKKSFVLHKASPINGTTGIYCYQQNFSPDLVSGRSFVEEDFSSQTNVALVCEALYDELRATGEEATLLFDNDCYEVIGVYRRSNNQINSDSRAYYNLGSSNILQGDNSINYCKQAIVISDGKLVLNPTL
ncbi:MAG: ABC transporter permease [Coriobacteriia bacterium]|nr:ABC transporter permease [Coriobacteriia bacterium]